MSKSCCNLWPFFLSSSFECSLLCSVLLWHSAALFCSALLLQLHNRQQPVALMPSIPFSAVKWYFLFKRGAFSWHRPTSSYHHHISAGLACLNWHPQSLTSLWKYQGLTFMLQESFDVRLEWEWNHHSKAFKSKGIEWMLVSAWRSGWPGCTGREGAFALWASLTHGTSWMEIALSR